MTPSQRKCPACGTSVENNISGSGQCLSCGHDLVTTAPRPAWFVGKLDLRAVAKRQRELLWIILASLVVQIGPPAFAGIIGIGAYDQVLAVAWWALVIVLQIVAIVSVFRLQTALETHVAWRILTIVFLFAPCINLLILVLVSNRATLLLQRAGLKVGLMGASDEQVVRLLGSNRCRNCGYILIGVESAVCPECGQPLAAVQS